ncbi:hypothetical protein BH18ACT5_BH18ACT5_07970 [soil metagenome]
MKLIIVESPAKARTISRFLGNGVTVEASMGHVRDLPSKGLGVDVEGGFVPTYVVSPGKEAVITRLRAALKKADELYLATDEDREGESIAWHLTEVLKPKVQVKRMVFHEITEPAIQSAFASPRDIDRKLVDAQEARRILDRLYGFGVSPVLWRRIKQGLSAGRVQSVAIRIVVERERERIAFVAAGYWDLLATVSQAGSFYFPATLVQLDGAKVATGADFDATGTLVTQGAVVLDERGARALAGALEQAAFSVRSVEQKPYRRSPYPPFRTSTLQQEASRKLRFSTSRTMSIAQRLYEAGYIT